MVFHLAASLWLLERSDLLCVGFLLLPCCLVAFPNQPADPCLGGGARAGRVAAAVPLCMTSLSHSSALSKYGALNLILLSFEALQTI